jgi:hypothetical protein
VGFVNGNMMGNSSENGNMMGNSPENINNWRN